MSESQLTQTVRLAQAFNERDLPQKAIDTLDRASADERETLWFWFVRAAAFLRLRQFEQMAVAAEKGLAIEPEATMLHLMLALAAEERRDLASAERHILIRLRDEPEDVEALCQYADLLVKGGDIDKAEKVLNRAVTLDPEAATIDGVRGKIAYLRGDTKGAVRSAENALARDPEGISARTALGSYLLEQGKITHANRHFRDAVRSDPSQQEVADVARAFRTPMHPLLYPLRILEIIPRGLFWAGAFGTILLLNVAGFERASTIVAVIYLVFVAYSWIVPPLLRWWLNRS